MLELMLRAVIVGALASAAAWLFEQAFAHLRVGRRFAWTFALLATLVLPFVPRLFDGSPAAVIPEFSAPPIVLNVAPSAASFDVDYARLAWIILSLMAALVFAVSYVRLQRERRSWRGAKVADEPVLLSQQFGPAVFGFTTPQIVLPEWLQATSHEEQRLIVLHEREHIRARDQLQLLLSIIATIAMPWNPLVWLQARRLRFTVEADCDQRVLAAEPDAARYATLLVDVGSKQTGLLLTPALAEHRNGLERRLRMLASRLIQNRWKAAALVICGLLVTAIACESRLPYETVEPERELTQSDDIIERYYPPLLRAAGIGGTVGVRVHVGDGGVADEVIVRRSSGHEALDYAAVKVAKAYQWGHEGPGRPTSYWTSTSITFHPSGKPPLKQIDPEAGPQFTPYTDRPRLQNRDEVSRALVRNYPPLLRDAGIGGTLLAWTLLGEDGKVIKAQIKESSGHEELDAAGLKVIELMEFTPAVNKEERVKVWIQLPVVFKTK